jgi:hypothetical protein
MSLEMTAQFNDAALTLERELESIIQQGQES